MLRYDRFYTSFSLFGSEIDPLLSQFTSIELLRLSTSIAKRIFRNYKKAADKNDADSVFHVGVCYSVGYGVAKDEKKALEWCICVADIGSLGAKSFLAANFD